MSELEDRWFWAYPTESVDCDGISGSAHEVYSKSDADAVIAEKDKEIRRQKYKRCLDKANYWVAISYHCIDDKHRQRAEKRHYKWLKLAENFKEAK